MVLKKNQLFFLITFTELRQSGMIYKAGSRLFMKISLLLFFYIPMTTQDLIQEISAHPKMVIILLGIPPLLAILFSFMFKKEDIPNSNLKYLYSVLVYLSCIPGVISVILILYTFFFLKGNFLEVDVLAYFLPLTSMIVTLLLIKRTIAFDLIPGFKRLSGVFVLIAVAFIFSLVLYNLNFHVGVFFLGSVKSLVFIFILLLALLVYGYNKVVK